MPVVLLDTNLLLLVLVGRTDPSLIASHKRTCQFDKIDFAVVETLVSAYDGYATTAHVLTETSNLVRQIANPARNRIQQTLVRFVEESEEFHVPSIEVCAHEDFLGLGLTDVAILVACATSASTDDYIELLTADEPIYNRAMSLGLPAEFYGA